MLLELDRRGPISERFQDRRSGDDVWRLTDRRKLLAERLKFLFEVVAMMERRALRHHAATADQLGRLIERCRRAIKGNVAVPPNAIADLMEPLSDAGALLRYQAAVLITPEYVQAAVEDGRADQQIDHSRGQPALLLRLAERALGVVAPSVVRGRGGGRHKKDDSAREAIRSVGMLFFELTGEIPTISLKGSAAMKRDMAGYGGKFLPFAWLILKSLGMSRSDHGIYALWRSVRDDDRWTRADPGADAKRARRTD